jgi:cytidylate kinase
MNSHGLLERADSYLNTEWRGSRGPWPRASGPFITLSREAGSGGASLARLMARQLNADAPRDVVWHVFEGDLTAHMLKENRMPTRYARFLPEDRVPEWTASVGELVGLHPSLWELVRKTNESMRDLARKGHVILVGRGANFATANISSGMHVRLVAPAEHRARYLGRLYNLPESDAAALNARCDAARRRYVKTTFNADVSDPAHYDLVLNTARVSLPEAAAMIVSRIKAMTPRGD